MRWNAKWNLPALGLLGLTVLLFYTQTNPLIISGGYVVLSVSKVDYTANDPTITGPTWLITLVQKERAQYISGIISKDQLKDTEANVQAKNDISIKMDMRDMSVKYDISKQNDFIYRLEIYKTNQWTDCPQGYDSWASRGIWDKYCLKKTATAAYGLIRSPTVGFRTDVSVTSGGKTETAVLSNLDTTSINIGKAGQISWVGNLVTGELPPIAADQKISAAYVYSRNGWITIDDQAWLSYKTYRDSTMAALVGNQDASIEKAVERYNRLADAAIQWKSLTSSGGTVANTQGTQDSGQVTLQLARQIQFPVMVLRLRADWVETITINVPVGQPQILKATSQDFQTGSNGFITVTVKNIGSGDGSFAVSTQCGSPMSVTGTTLNLPVLKPNEQTDVYVPLSGNAVSKTSSTCTVKAYDRNNPGNQDSTTVQVTVTPIILCKAGEKRINGNTIEQCSAEGSGWQVIEVCANDEEPRRSEERR